MLRMRSLRSFQRLSPLSVSFSKLCPTNYLKLLFRQPPADRQGQNLQAVVHNCVLSYRLLDHEEHLWKIAGRSSVEKSNQG